MCIRKGALHFLVCAYGYINLTFGGKGKHGETKFPNAETEECECFK